MNITATIIPIFIIVVLGWWVHRRGFLPAEFLGPANRLVFYVALPAMIFHSIARSKLREWLNPQVVLLTLLAAILAYAGAWLICRFSRMQRATAGAFILSAAHGNQGYLGLAVAYYYLGDQGLAHASVVAGFLMILQNVLSIGALHLFAPPGAYPRDPRLIALRVMGNPVILGVLAGMAFSVFALPLPAIMDRTLAIVSGLALPTALLVIGATLSPRAMWARGGLVTGAAAIKLLLLPAIGWLLFHFAGLPKSESLPATILLASPTATITFVLAKEMQGDGDLAVASISASTLASALTYMAWLKAAAW